MHYFNEEDFIIYILFLIQDIHSQLPLLPYKYLLLL
jgi:hypothetical protein